MSLSRRQYLVIRLALWAIAVFIALLPFVMGRKHESWHNAEEFRDLLFVVVPVSALGLAATFDYLCVGFPDYLTARSFFNSIGSIFLNGIGLTTGLAGFLNIRDGVLSGGQFWTYSTLICAAIVTSLVTEVVVSLNHHGFNNRNGMPPAPPIGPPQRRPLTGDSPTVSTGTSPATDS